MKRALAIFALASCAFAAELPDAPSPAVGVVNSGTPAPRPIKQPFFANDANRALVVGEFTTRLLDAISTEQFIHNPCKCMHERVLPAGIVQHQAAMYSYSFGVAAGVTLLSDELWKHNHHKLARIPLLIDISSESIASVNNWIVIDHAHKAGGK